MNFIDSKRRIDITVTSTDDLALWGRKFTFEPGSILNDGGQALSAMPPWAVNGLIELCKEQLRVSGIIAGELCNPEDIGQKLTITAEHYIDLTYGDILDYYAKNTPQKEAVTDASGEKRYSYGELGDWSDYLAKALIHVGIRVKNHVAVIMENSPEHMAVKFGISKAGAVVVNINGYEKQDMIENLLKDSDIVAVIIKPGVKAEEHIRMLYEICPELEESKPGELTASRLPMLRAVIVAGAEKIYPGTFRLEELTELGERLPEGEFQCRKRVINHKNVATIIHTSGTTGKPKGVMLTHSAIIENALTHVKILGLDSQDRLCMTPPMFHAFGSIGSALTIMAAGGTLVCYNRSDGIDLLTVLLNQKCTALCSVPTVYIRMISNVLERGMDLEKGHLKKCITAGAPCPEQLLSDMRQVLKIRSVIVMYGMTEAGPGIASIKIEDGNVIKTVMGADPWPGVSVKIVDTEGCGKNIGQTGEICIKSYGLMKGYYHNPGETQKAIDREGWLHTGDVGKLDEDGGLSILGRCKDIIIRGGENIAPREIEEYLMRHENIEDAVVVGASDYKLGERVFAFVRLVSGKRMTCEEVRAFCKGKIATIKIPERIEFVQEFPVSSTGKVLKMKLRKRAEVLTAEGE